MNENNSPNRSKNRNKNKNEKKNRVQAKFELLEIKYKHWCGDQRQYHSDEQQSLHFCFLLKLNGFCIILMPMLFFSLTLYCSWFFYNNLHLLKCKKKVCAVANFCTVFLSIYFSCENFSTLVSFFCLLSHCITLLWWWWRQRWWLVRLRIPLKNEASYGPAFKLKSISHAIFISIISSFFCYFSS